MIFNLLGSRHTLLSRQATWIAAKLGDSTLNGPLFAKCCATAVMFFAPAHAQVYMRIWTPHAYH